MIGGTVFLKLENLQITGSFKLRGAMNKLLSLGRSERRRGVAAASSGNHGAAVCHGARILDSRAVIFVPEDTSPAKVEAIRALGGEVRVEGADCVVAEAAARFYGHQHGLTYVSPYNDPQVIAGQGTVGLEMARQLEALDTVYVALGGGGLISGIAGYLKSLAPDLEVVACSPESSSVMADSVRAGRILDQDSKPTLSDGTAGGVEPGAITFELCREIIDESLLVSEEQIRHSVRLIIGRHHTLIEGAAGVAVAGYLANRDRFAEMDVAIVLCGANIDAAVLREIL